MVLRESEIKCLIKEIISDMLSEGDRHRPGYYAEYAKRRKEQGLSTDRHRPGYYEEYAKTHPDWAAKHPEKLKQDDGVEKTDIATSPKRKKKKKKSRKEYYRQYNLAHPDRLERISMELHSYEDELAMRRFGTDYEGLSSSEQMEIDDMIVMDDMRDEDGYGDWYPGDN